MRLVSAPPKGLQLWPHAPKSGPRHWFLHPDVALNIGLCTQNWLSTLAFAPRHDFLCFAMHTTLFSSLTLHTGLPIKSGLCTQRFLSSKAPTRKNGFQHWPLRPGMIRRCCYAHKATLRISLCKNEWLSTLACARQNRSQHLTFDTTMALNIFPCVQKELPTH